MAEQTDQPVEGAESTAQTPDLSEFFAKIEEANEKRFKGFQSLLDRRDTQWREQLNELKTASMEPEDREQFAIEEAQRKLKAVERERDLLMKRREYPDEVDFLVDFLKADSFEDQLELVRAYRKGQAEAATPTDSSEEPEAATPAPVDGNNPSRKIEDSLSALINRGAMTKEAAEKLLKASDEPGILSRIRGRG